MKNKLLFTSCTLLLTATTVFAKTSNSELLKRIEVLENKQKVANKLTIGGDYR